MNRCIQPTLLGTNDSSATGTGHAARRRYQENLSVSRTIIQHSSLARQLFLKLPVCDAVV